MTEEDEERPVTRGIRARERKVGILFQMRIFEVFLLCILKCLLADLAIIVKKRKSIFLFSSELGLHKCQKLHDILVLQEMWDIFFSGRNEYNNISTSHCDESSYVPFLFSDLRNK